MPDKRVQAAIDNWGPRFTSQGVDYNDFVRTTAKIERWEDWLGTWCATGDIHAGLARQAEAEWNLVTAGEAYVRAALCYHFAKFVWMLDKVQYRAAAARAIESLYQAHRLLDPTAERIEAPLAGLTLVGNLRRPRDAGRPALVLLLPGLDSCKEEFFHWENVFLARGMATLSMEGPGQGEPGYHSAIRPEYESAVSAMLDGLDGRQDLDLARIGAVGVSLGGYYAPRAAAFEPRLRAAVAIGGPYNFGDCWDRLPPLTRQTFVHHSGSQDEAEARAKAGQLSLEGILPDLRQPLLVVFGKLDRLIPWQQAERVAAEAPEASLVMYEEGNHVCNNIPYKYRPLAADWLRRNLEANG